MIPIHKLLDRIKWDSEFGRGNFIIGYYDRVEDRIIRVPFRELIIEPGNHYSFHIMDSEGVVQTIPFHRVREVLRNNSLIWSRDDKVTPKE